MRILLTAYSCCPNKGSEPGYGWNWAIELSKKAEQVYCYTRSVNRKEILKELSKLHIANLEFVFVDPPAFFEKHYKTNKVGLYVHYIMWQHEVYKTAKKLKQYHNYSVVHHVSFASLQLGSFMYKLKLPFIFGPVGGGQFAPKKFKSYFGKYWKIEIARKFTSILLLLLNPATKKTIRNATVVLAANLETQKMAHRIGAKNVRLMLDPALPASFYPKKIKSELPSNVLQILWVGRLMPRKGLQLVLESLAMINPNVNYHLTIVGNGEMGVYVNKWIEELSLKGKVTWLGQLPFDEVKRQYLKSNLFILTSLRDTCPTQLLEAMAHGLPVVSLDLHGASLAVPNGTGIKIKPINPEQTKTEVANAIQLLAQNRDMLISMGKKAYEYALEQTWEKKVKLVYENCYPVI